MTKTSTVFSGSFSCISYLNIVRSSLISSTVLSAALAAKQAFEMITGCCKELNDYLSYIPLVQCDPAQSPEAEQNQLIITAVVTICLARAALTTTQFLNTLSHQKAQGLPFHDPRT